MEEWKKYLTEASDYCRVAERAHKKKTLGNVVLYNVVSMAIESFLMARLVSEGRFPEHSGLSSMLRELKKIVDVPDEFTHEVRFLNSFMNFCSLEVCAEKIPTDEEIERMVVFVQRVDQWTHKSLCTMRVNPIIQS